MPPFFEGVFEGVLLPEDCSAGITLRTLIRARHRERGRLITFFELVDPALTGVLKASLLALTGEATFVDEDLSCSMRCKVSKGMTGSINDGFDPSTRVLYTNAWDQGVVLVADWTRVRTIAKSFAPPPRVTRAVAT